MNRIIKNISAISLAAFLNVAGRSPACGQQKVSEWKAPAGADTIKNPLPFNEESIKKGKTTFTQFCVPCHGDKGKGDGIAGAALNPKPGILISAKVQSQKDGALFWKISTGRNAMVSFAPSLTKEQRWAVINYIRFLAKTENKK